MKQRLEWWGWGRGNRFTLQPQAAAYALTTNHTQYFLKISTYSGFSRLLSCFCIYVVFLGCVQEGRGKLSDAGRLS